MISTDHRKSLFVGAYMALVDAMCSCGRPGCVLQSVAQSFFAREHILIEEVVEFVS
jgi:hypothetical protein